MESSDFTICAFMVFTWFSSPSLDVETSLRVFSVAVSFAVRAAIADSRRAVSTSFESVATFFDAARERFNVSISPASFFAAASFAASFSRRTLTSAFFRANCPAASDCPARAASCFFNCASSSAFAAASFADSSTCFRDAAARDSFVFFCAASAVLREAI